MGIHGSKRVHASRLVYRLAARHFTISDLIHELKRHQQLNDTQIAQVIFHLEQLRNGIDDDAEKAERLLE